MEVICDTTKAYSTQRANYGEFMPVLGYSAKLMHIFIVNENVEKCRTQIVALSDIHVLCRAN